MPPLPRRTRSSARVLLVASIGASSPLLGAACSPAAPAPSAPFATVSIAAAPPATSSVAAAPPPPSAPPIKAEVARLVCGDRPRCEVQRERAAGQDPQGRTLSVIRAYTGLELVDGATPPPSGGDAGAVALGLEETDRTDTLSPAIGMGGCQRFEYWLLVRDDKAPPAATRLLSACNEGHGASGVGEDTITVGDNRLEHASSGGSSWRWDRAEVLSLSPLQIRSSSNAGFWTLGPNVARSTFRWDDFAGDHAWSSPACDPNGDPVEGAGPIGELGPDAFAYLPIPAVDLEGEYRSSGWKTAALGACAARVDATGKSGFVTHGEPGAAGDASMSVVASKQGELFVEVRDDTWVGPSARWVTDDHLELWLAKALPTYLDHCLSDAKAEVPRQWGIRVLDGKVFAGAGKPDEKAIGVEAARGSAGEARLKITLPRGFLALTVVYSDSDDGKKQERLIATSKLRAGRVATLGALLDVNPRRAVCGAASGTLSPRLLEHRGDEAILGDE